MHNDMGYKFAYRPCVVVFDTRALLFGWAIISPYVYSTYGAEGSRGVPLFAFFRLFLCRITKKWASLNNQYSICLTGRDISTFLKYSFYQSKLSSSLSKHKKSPPICTVRSLKIIKNSPFELRECSLRAVFWRNFGQNNGFLYDLNKYTSQKM